MWLRHDLLLIEIRHFTPEIYIDYSSVDRSATNTQTHAQFSYDVWCLLYKIERVWEDGIQWLTNCRSEYRTCTELWWLSFSCIVPFEGIWKNHFGCGSRHKKLDVLFGFVFQIKFKCRDILQPLWWWLMMMMMMCFVGSISEYKNGVNWKSNERE